jgi:RNA polymerase sigma factor (sigma-70 family)
MRVHDSDVSVSTAPGVAIPDASGDVAWAAEAYDSFAGALYAYCRSLVREPAAAADAVRDTFVVTAFRLDDLPADGLLRPWLYAVARNECLRAISSGQATTAVDFLPNELPGEAGADSQPSAQLPPGPMAGTGSGTPDAASPDITAGDAENVRALLRAALGGLDPADRDLMVMAWHDLDITECALVLGISRDAALKAFTRARDHLGQCAGALVVARSQPRECGPLSEMLASWDGLLTPALSSELRPHIDHCDICAGTRRGGPRPADLQLPPDVMRTMAATAGISRLAAWVTSRLRDQVLAAAFDQELESFEHRAMVVRRAGPFRDDRFPVAVAPPGLAARGNRRPPLVLVLAGVGGAGLAAIITIAALTLSGNHSTGIMQAWAGLSNPKVTASSGGAGSSAAVTGSPSHRATSSPSHTAATAAPGSTPSASTSASGKPSSQPSGTRTPAGPSSPSPTGPPTTATAAQLGLRVSPMSLTLQQQRWGGDAGTLTLTNPTDSTIDWSVSVPGGSHLTVWRHSSGNLQPGQQTTLNIYLQDQHARGDSQASTIVLIISPGNIQVSVTIP